MNTSSQILLKLKLENRSFHETSKKVLLSNEQFTESVDRFSKDLKVNLIEFKKTYSRKSSFEMPYSVSVPDCETEA